MGISNEMRESIFSGANNFTTYTISENDKFSKDFGITEEEMENIINNFKIQINKKEIENLDAGHIIGHTGKIYNPWNILNYIANRTKFRKDISKLLDRTIKYNEPINITAKKGNAIVLSEKDYNNIIETLYICSIHGLKENVENYVKEDEVEW